MIEEIIPGNRTRFRILETIYENPGINITNLIKKVKASPNLVLSYINKLLSYNIIKEEKIGGKKKIHVRSLTPNFNNELAHTFYSLIKINKKELFLKKYSNLRPILNQLYEEFEEKRAVILIYGSYARFSAERDSDLDVIIIGKLKKEEISKIREIFITFEAELSLKIETPANFLKSIQKPLYQNILKSHIVLNNANEFIRLLDKINK